MGNARDEKRVQRKTFKRKYISRLKKITEQERYNSITTDPESILDTKYLLDKLFKIIVSSNIEDGLKWILGLEEYVEDKNDKNVINYRKYSRGHIVEVELFGHFDKELTFSHPAVVLYNSGNFVLIAPISSGKFGDGNEMHIDISSKDGVKKDCCILIDSIRVIDKKRIMYQHKKDEENIKISDTILDNIDEVLVTKYAPKVKNEFENCKTQLNDEKERHKTTLNELKKTKLQLEKKDEELKKLKDELLIVNSSK
ncbi:type II toxin-antitoxin system PemK/MazF family toxin [Sutcliffiella cohnii]|uniref:type II toxin-antitoxin system PemK/MazF family toxin n=1 Tax=Sutcliffiella cohnii TaxID=33932 RepID=UPI00082E2157|nr:type II toxin-antitoxin system PemK/MazF family toxin [Sutcliffiella cohnii]